MAARVVEQVDEHAPQVLGVEHHADRLARQLDLQDALLAELDPGGLRPLAAHLGELRGGVDRADFLHPAGRHFHDVVDDPLQPLDVLGHHLRQLALRRIGGVLGEQGIGLGDRRERIADLVGDAGRDPAHGGELLLAAARLHVAHVLEEQHADLLAGARLALAREAHPHAQRPVRVGRELQRHVAAGLGPGGFGERPLDRVDQRAPGRHAAQLERRRAAHAFRREQAARRRVGGAHLAAAVDHQHAVLHLLDHQAIQRRLLARHLEAAARAQLLAREPAGELAGEHGDDEEAAAGQARLGHQQRSRRRRRAGRTQAVPSSASVASAAVASASTRGVSTPAISTGSTSRAT